MLQAQHIFERLTNRVVILDGCWAAIGGLISIIAAVEDGSLKHVCMKPWTYAHARSEVLENLKGTNQGAIWAVDWCRCETGRGTACCRDTNPNCFVSVGIMTQACVHCALCMSTKRAPHAGSTLVSHWRAFGSRYQRLCCCMLAKVSIQIFRKATNLIYRLSFI